MSSNSHQTLQLSSDRQTPIFYHDLFNDPEFCNFIEQVIQARVSSVEQGYRGEMATRENVWNERETQFKVMEEQMQSLTDQLAKVNAAQARSDV